MSELGKDWEEGDRKRWLASWLAEQQWTAVVTMYIPRLPKPWAGCQE